MFSIATAPAKQSVSETISVLSGRLSSATLLEDRRAAILGLRSFAKEYPASVASGALRSLIGSLSKDGEDVDTVKVVLETLLMLFSPNADSLEASEEIALWLADEFTQRLENITLLLDFLETNDFYARLYSLQLLSAILAARTDRTQECIFTAPLGISRLVAILDDRRDVIRNEALTLLTYLTPTSTEIQKLVAFDSAFERLFAIIQEEGSVLDGGRVIEDCLILLSNLLRLNAHNQTLFRESLGTAQLSRLLQDVAAPGRADEEEVVAAWALAQRNRNIYALLAVIRLFLVPGAAGTVQNQAEFWRHGVLFHALQLAFNSAFEVQIRAEALATCAAIIRGNAALQEGFAQLRVPSPLEPPTPPPPPPPPASVSPVPPAHGHAHETDKANKATKTNGVAHPPEVYVIDGLLDLTLCVHSVQFFDLRMAACACLKAYFHGHEMVRLHFLQRAVDGHASGADESANVLTTLLRPPSTAPAGDPYRHWFAAVIMFHLVYENPKAKALVMAVTEGDEDNGEEVVTSIQTIAAHLLGSVHRGDDERVVIGYLMLLLGWLFESLDGVSDFLGEGSNVQGLIQLVNKNTSTETAVQGLAAMLLGVLYEFSTKDSPIPRAKLHEILMGRMGRDRYSSRLSALRAYPPLREFEVLPQKLDPLAEQKLPDVFFDGAFVDFFKDHYSRVLRALDREPGLEISVVTNGVQQGISRALVDELRAELGERERTLRAAQERISTLENALGEERAEHKRVRESGTAELARVHAAHEAERAQARAAHEAALATVRAAHETELAQARAAHDALVRSHDEALRQTRAEQQKSRDSLQRQMEQAHKALEAEAARTQRRLEAELADVRATSSRLEVDLMKATKAKAQELQAARDGFQKQLAEAEAATAAAQKTVQSLEGRLVAADIQVAELREALEAAEEDSRKMREKAQAAGKELKKAQDELKKAQEEKAATQTELDDLLMVFADLEEKAAGYKTRLKELGESISDDEDGDEGDEDADDDEEDKDEEKDDDDDDDDDEVD